MADTTRIMRDTRDTMASHAANIADDLHEIRDAARRTASDSANAFRETASQVVDEGRTRARALSGDIQTKVQEQPMKSVLIAAGVGFLLGLFWLRR